MNKDISEGLINNAFDFFDEALNPVVLKENPTRSIVNFVVGVELVLKARLIREHWTLVLKNPCSTNHHSFSNGNFVSVSIDEAIQRIKTVCNEDLGIDLDRDLKNILHTRN